MARDTRIASLPFGPETEKLRPRRRSLSDPGDHVRQWQRTQGAAGSGSNTYEDYNYNHVLSRFKWPFSFLGFLFISILWPIFLATNVSAQIPSQACMRSCPVLTPSPTIYSQYPTITYALTKPETGTSPGAQPFNIQPSSGQPISVQPSANPSNANLSPVPSTPVPSGQAPTGGAVGACGPGKTNLFKNPFNKNSAQHRPIGTGAIYASDTDPATQDWLGASGFNINVGASFGALIFEASPSDTYVTIGCDTTWRKHCSGTPVTLRLAANLQGATDSDAAANVYDDSTGTLHEFYRFYTTNGYTAAIHLSMPIRDLGHTPVGQNIRSGVTASGMSIFTGLLRGHEVNTSGYKIQHTLNFSVPGGPGKCAPAMSSQTVVWPASSKDGYCSDREYCTGHIPYGALLAIPPVSKGGPDLNTLGLSEPGLRVAEALRDYGMYLYDTARCVTMRTDQFVTSGVASQLKADLARVYKYIRMILNNDGRQPVSGGGDALAPNCAFDAT
jgi:hypothetical protein